MGVVVVDDGREKIVVVVAADMLACWVVQEGTGCWGEPGVYWRLDCG